MNPALVQLIILLAPYGIQLVQYFVQMAGIALTELAESGHRAVTLGMVSAAVIDGINVAHPDWSDTQRAAYAADAIAAWKAKHLVCVDCQKVGQ